MARRFRGRSAVFGEFIRLRSSVAGTVQARVYVFGIFVRKQLPRVSRSWCLARACRYPTAFLLVPATRESHIHPRTLIIPVPYTSIIIVVHLSRPCIDACLCLVGDGRKNRKDRKRQARLSTLTQARSRKRDSQQVKSPASAEECLILQELFTGLAESAASVRQTRADLPIVFSPTTRIVIAVLNSAATVGQVLTIF